MYSLSIDTATSIFSVSVFDNNTEVFFHLDDEPQMQSKKLVQTIQQALANLNITYAQLDNLVVNIGPGSFTGVRIGLAAIEGIALVTNKPIIAISAFEALCLVQPRDNSLITIDAGRGNYYCQEFNGNALTGDILILSQTQIDKQYAGKNITGALGTPRLLSNSSFIAKAAIKKGFAPSKIPVLPIYGGGRWDGTQ